ncbi:MAG TPA: rhodanese-like domain-containing protein [Rhodobacteraceae bacterium]|jgi:rhodanese-related sulfurtransferase|nr:rhodanese-like domain-containing protein [Paracoccaceae bacterium]HBG98012.1 rhodanese-like domain-containing protein [Paracoccaceae bacterium]
MQEETIEGKVLENWTVDEVAEAFTRGEIVLIDVRTPQEFMMEHIRGALLSPMAFFEPAHLPAEDTKRIVFHCGSGIRSKMVAAACLNAGAERVAHMEGGFMAWKQAKLPYIGTDPATGGPRPVA